LIFEFDFEVALRWRLRVRVAVPVPFSYLGHFRTLIDLVCMIRMGVNVSPVKCVCINKSACIYIPHNKKNPTVVAGIVKQ